MSANRCSRRKYFHKNREQNTLPKSTHETPEITHETTHVVENIVSDCRGVARAKIQPRQTPTMVSHYLGESTWGSGGFGQLLVGSRTKLLVWMSGVDPLKPTKLKETMNEFHAQTKIVHSQCVGNSG